MWQFYTICFSVVLFGLLGRNYNKKLVYTFFFFLFVLEALRAPSIGNDTSSYIYIFQHVNIAGISTRIESGFMLLLKGIYAISDNPQVFLAVTSGIITTGFALFISKQSKYSWVSVFLFITAGLMRFSFSAIRQCIVIIIFLFSLRFIKDRKLLKYSICVLFAFTFHQSAIILIIAYFLYEVREENVLKFGFAFTFVGFIIFPKMLELVFKLLPSYSRYVYSNYFNNGVTVAAIMQAMISVAVFALSYYLYNYKKEDNDQINSFYLKMVFVRMCLMILSIRLSNIDRFAEYFSPFEIVLIPNLLLKLQPKNRQAYCVVIVFFFMLYCTIWYYGHPETQTIWPYHFFFNY